MPKKKIENICIMMSSKMDEDDNSRDFMDNTNNNNNTSSMETQHSSAMSKAQLRKVGFYRPVINFKNFCVEVNVNFN